MIRAVPTLLFVAALLPATFSIAQSPITRPVTDASKEAAVAVRAPDANASDAILANWLHSACTNHIAIANLAVKQSKNAEVTAFAQQLVVDHTAFAQKLLPFTSSMTTGRAVEPATGKPVPIAADAKAAPVAAFDHAALIRDLGAKCLQSTTQMLAAKTGPEFDRCFLQLEVAAHQQGKDMVEVFKTYASPRLRPTLDAALTQLTTHHDRAVAMHHKCAAPVDGGGGNR
jgi:predicted outer membrane protein